MSQERGGVSRIPEPGRGCGLSRGGVTGAAQRGLEGEVGGRESTSPTDVNAAGGAERSANGLKKENESKRGVYLDQRQKSRGQGAASEPF